MLTHVIYHIPSRKVGCTKDLDYRRRLYLEAEGVVPDILPIHVPAKIPLDPFDHWDFNSWLEFVNCANDESLYAWSRTSARRSHENGYVKGPPENEMFWRGTETWEDCISMALRTGWPKGRDLLYEALAIVRPRPEPFKSIEMSVAGAFPIVPNYCAGDPECMVMDPGSNLRMTKPIIRIDYNHWIQATTTPQDMILRGAAVLSLAETLERYGYSTELRIIGNSGNERIFRYSVVFKRAGEMLDIDRAAFAIAHPSSMRRLAFAILEQHPELEDTFHHGYGIPQFEPNDPDPNTIFIPGSTGHETPEIAKRAVENAASEILSEIQQIEAGD